MESAEESAEEPAPSRSRRRVDIQSPRRHSISIPADFVQEDDDDDDDLLVSLRGKSGRSLGGKSGSQPMMRHRATRLGAEVVVGKHSASLNSGLHKYPLPHNVYGLIIFTLTWEHCSCGKKWLRMLLAFVLFSVSLVTQIGICLIVLAGPIAFDEIQYKNGLRKGWGVELRTALATNVSLDESSSEALQACLKEHCAMRGVLACYYFALLLWITRMVQELSDHMWLTVAVWHAPSVSQTCVPDCDNSGSDESSSEEDDEDDDDREHRVAPALSQLAKTEEVYITKLHPFARLLIMGTVGVVRFTTYLLVQWTGIRFLVLATSTYNLIIKCLAFQWIVTIPDLLFNAAASRAMRERVKKTSLMFRRPALGQWQWDEWLSSVVRLSLMFGGLWAVLHTSKRGSHSIMLFRYDCQEYARRFGTSEGDGHGFWLLLENNLMPWDNYRDF